MSEEERASHEQKIADCDRRERVTKRKERTRSDWLDDHSHRGSRVDLWGAALHQAHDVAKKWFRARDVHPAHFLVTVAADLDGEGDMHMTAFALSAALGDVQMMRLFLDYCEEHGLDSIANGIKRAKGKQPMRQGEPHVQERDYATPLMAAVKGRSIAAIRTLQRYCPDLDMDSLESFDRDGHGHIAAMSYAAEHGLKEIGELLWFEGARLDTMSDTHSSPWSLAFNNQHTEMRDWISAKEDEEEQNREKVEHKGRGPGNKWGPDMSRPVEKGDLFEAKEGNKTAMYYAAEHNLVELVKIMLGEGASVLPRSGKDGKTSEVDERGYSWAKKDGYTPSEIAYYKGFTTMESLLYPIERAEEDKAHAEQRKIDQRKQDKRHEEGGDKLSLRDERLEEEKRESEEQQKNEETEALQAKIKTLEAEAMTRQRLADKQRESEKQRNSDDLDRFMYGAHGLGVDTRVGRRGYPMQR